MNSSGKHPLVSCAVITYNHEHFISACIDGILDQCTSFPFEICIGDDNSSDGTSRICDKFVSSNKPHYTIRHNIWDRSDPSREQYDAVFMPNVVQTLKSCSGKYIAIVEGDDCWIDRFKLQTQISFLEDNPDYSLCLHNAGVILDSNKISYRLHIDTDKNPEMGHDCDFSATQWPSILIPSSSFVMRRDVAEVLISSPLAYTAAWDTTILYLANTIGKIRYLAKPMSCYRIHSDGLWNGSTAINHYYTMLQVAGRLITYLPNPSKETTEWLKILFDYNFIKLASSSISSDTFKSLIAHYFPNGTSGLHASEWCTQVAVQSILAQIDINNRLLRSTSFKVGNALVRILIRPYSLAQDLFLSQIKRIRIF